MEKKTFIEAEAELVAVNKADDVIATSTLTGGGIKLPIDEW